MALREADPTAVEEANGFRVEDWMTVTKNWAPEWGWIVNETRRANESDPNARQRAIDGFRNQKADSDERERELQFWVDLLSISEEAGDKLIIALKRNFPDRDFGSGS